MKTPGFISMFIFIFVFSAAAQSARLDFSSTKLNILKFFVSDEPRVLDEYGKISWRDEKLRLQSVAEELKNDKDTVAIFIVYTQKKVRSQILKIREEKIKKFLFEKFKISKDRLIFVDAGHGENNTKIYIIPKGIPFPPT